MPVAAICAILWFVWLFSILIGTAYIVFWLGYSGWWWLLAIALMASPSSGKDDD